MPQKIKIVLVIIVWLFVWTIGRLFYYFNFITRLMPFLKDLENYRYLFFAGWLVFAGLVVFLVWQRKKMPFYFLKIKQKVWLLFYLIPLGQLGYWFFQESSPFGLAGGSYALIIIIATLAQDLFTFGFLQTLLENLVKPWLAALLTILTFFLGHFYFQLSFLTLIFIVGFFGFAFLRLKYRNIYALNVIHLIFSLLPWRF